jgi:hypothetical protein
MKILLILLLAVPCYSQITTRYDKFKDASITTFSDGWVHAKTAHDGVRLKFYAYYTHPGQVKRDEQYWLMFSNYCRLDCMGRGNNLIFLVDGNRMALGAGQYGLENLRAPLGLQERLLYSISREELDSIANAKEVSFQLGKFETELSEKQKAGIKELLSQ